MVIPKRHEAHIRACALCGEIQVYGNQQDADRWLIKHAKYTHRKMNGYVEDAPKTLTILFEGEKEEGDQDPAHYDPTTTFLTVISTLKEEGRWL